MKMKINKTIKINIEFREKDIVVRDSQTLVLVMGTTSVLGNLPIYDITKEGSKYIIPKKQVIKRLDKLENDIEKWTTRRDIIKQIVNGK